MHWNIYEQYYLFLIAPFYIRTYYFLSLRKLRSIAKMKPAFLPGDNQTHIEAVVTDKFP